MHIQPVGNINFGILKGYKTTHYGDYMWGVYKDYKIDIYNASKHNQKLIYVSDNKFLNWIKSKLIYFEDGIRKIVKGESRYAKDLQKK